MMNKGKMAGEVAAWLVDSMTDEQLERTVLIYIAEDFLENPENYSEVVEVIEAISNDEEKEG